MSRRTDTRRTRRATRARPTPKWLLSSKELDAIAQRRCLMILDVLSGTKAVTEAISEARISRGTYYQLEERALKAMLSALLPGAGESGPNPETTARLAQLEQKAKALEQQKRRAERLLLLTRKVISPGPMKTAPGRPPGSKNRPKRNGSKATPKSSTTPAESRPAASTPTPAGTGAP